jgi:hypothetical protein
MRLTWGFKPSVRFAGTPPCTICPSPKKAELYVVSDHHPRSLHPFEMNRMKIYPEGSTKIYGTNSKRIWRILLKVPSTKDDL